MTDDNSNLVDMDLDSFSKTFFGKDEPVATDEPEQEVEEKDEEVSENEDDALATDDEGSDEEQDKSEDEPEEEVEEEKPAKKGKKSFQDRIDELTRGKREAERREADLLKRLEALEARKTEDTKSEPKPLREQLSAEAPNPDAKDENGEPVYKLGEFDPQFIRDLTKFTIEQETKAAKEAAEAQAHQQKVAAEQEELRNSWQQKVEEVEKELPDLREKLGEVEEAFEGIDPNYGEFLAATIMSCDYGPQIMYYLSQNIGEARKIVASGPAIAALKIGELNGKFRKPTQEQRKVKKVSDAAPPPAARTRGSGGGNAPVAGDTRDLAAFSREFFK